MPAVAEKTNISPQEYLENEITAEFKHEYLNGETWVMAGASDNHVTVAMNLAFLLRQQLKGSTFRSYISDVLDH